MEKLLRRFDSVEVHHEFLCTHVQPLGVKYHMGLIGLEDAKQSLKSLHGASIHYSTKALFGDSSNKLSWLIEPLRQLFPQAKFIHLVRDGRKVTSSFFHKLKDECYDDRSTGVLQAWIDNPDKFEEPPPEKKYWWTLPRPQTPLAKEFRAYDQFERICFHWALINRVIIDKLASVNENQKRTFKLEDLTSRPDAVRELLEFLNLEYRRDDFKLMARPHNVNVPRDFLLTEAQRQKFEKIAGPMMRVFGYDDKEEYQVNYHPKEPNEVVETCDLCKGNQVRPMWRVPSSKRGLTACLCDECGLVQSLPRIDSVSERKVAISSGADWGNVRYGKGFGTDAAVEFLGQMLDFGRVRHCLDVGSNRGSFVLKLRGLHPHVSITAIEPDVTIVDGYCNVPGVEFKGDRIENVKLKQDCYDLVYCSHTLEHLHSPADVLCMLRRSMKDDGFLYVEVPNLEFIGQDDLVEEWFLDKHLYHFSVATLVAMVEAAGFSVAENAIQSDVNKIALMAQASVSLSADERPFQYQEQKHKHVGVNAEALIKRYTTTLKKNQKALESAARSIEEMAQKERVVMWGAGRIFDSLVRLGGLDTQLLSGVIDKHLIHHVAEVHGCELQSPDQIATFSPKIVVIASRAFKAEIQRELQATIPGCKAIGFETLLDEASRGVL